MNPRRYEHFGDLYRAALAENNPEAKRILLAHVKTALDQWAEADRNRAHAASRCKPTLQIDRTSVHRVA
jgi:hypothetical protein